MTDEEHTLRLVKAQIATLPQEDQSKINHICAVFRGILEMDLDHGRAAIALIGAELAVMQS